MNQIVTTGIVLARTNYQEADRILTVLTPDQGKIRVMAKGVRKLKSKLAGGIELFSVSEISFIRGRGEISTLTSSRLKQHFGTIVQDMDRTMLGYELLKRLGKVTEDNAGEEYFEIAHDALRALDDNTIDIDLVRLWFDVQLLRITGHSPNLTTDVSDKKLTSEASYNFDLEKMAFSSSPKGSYNAGHIKLLRLAQTNQPAKLSRVSGMDDLLQPVERLTTSMRKNTLHL